MCFKKKYIDYNLNNQFSLFFVIASGTQLVQQVKSVNLQNKTYLEKDDVLFVNFNKFILNAAPSILRITYLSERFKNTSDSLSKRFKNIKINLGTKTFFFKNDKFLLHFAFA